MNCVSYDICVYHFGFDCAFFPGVFLLSRVTGACPVTTNLTVRVNVRTSTTTTTHAGKQGGGGKGSDQGGDVLNRNAADPAAGDAGARRDSGPRRRA